MTNSAYAPARAFAIGTLKRMGVERPSTTLASATESKP